VTKTSERNFVLINKNVLGEDFRFLCSVDSERVVRSTFTFSCSLRFLLIFLLLVLVRTLLADGCLFAWKG
jgi:hypothetical protein